jgi:starvation-inducible DNA-binding protein
MFEGQYAELSLAIDEIAERIRALGHKAPGTFDAFISMTMIKDANDKYEWKKMVRDLLQDHKNISLSIQKIIKTSEEEKDYVSNDMLISRLSHHQKITWMLEAML